MEDVKALFPSSERGGETEFLQKKITGLGWIVKPRRR
jgi:hypothetical protein